ncbi:MAG: response regulator [Pseudomonadota bacterium]
MKTYQIPLLLGLILLLTVCGLSIRLLQAAPGPMNLLLCLTATSTVLLVCFVAWRTFQHTYLGPLDSIAVYLQHFQAGEDLPARAAWLLPQLQALAETLHNNTSSREPEQHFRVQATNACLALTRRLIAFANLLATAPGDPHEYTESIRIQAERMAVLLREVTDTEYATLQEAPGCLLEILDESVAVYAELNPGRAPVYVGLIARARVYATLEGHLLQALLLHLLYLVQVARPQETTWLGLDTSGDSLKISFECGDLDLEGMRLTPRAQYLLTKLGATWDGATLIVPARQVQLTQATASQYKAAIVTPTTLEGRTIRQRLAAMGIDSDGSPATADFCIVTFPDDEDVYRVLKQSRAFSTLLVVGASTLYALPQVRQLSSPLHQRELDKAIQTLPTTAPVRPLALVVDDNLASLRLASIHLNNLGLETLTAQEGATALELALAHPVSVVLLDQHLPDTRGTQLAAAIHTHKPGLNIVLMSAEMDPDVVRDAQHQGIRALLSKPLNPTAVAKALADGAVDAKTVSAETGAQGSDPITSPFDAVLALRLANQQVELARTLLQELMTTVATETHSIEDAIKSGNRDRARELLHRFRGGLQYCGVQPLKQAADALASVLREGSDAAVGEALTVFLHQADLLVDWYDPDADYFAES